MQKNIIDGNKLAEDIISSLKRISAPKRSLVAILIGDDKASLSFLKKKSQIAEKLGVKFILHKFPNSLRQKDLEEKIKCISAKKSTGGVIIQLPLPKKYNRQQILNTIKPEKDIDALSDKNSLLLPPAVGATEHILKKIKFNPKGKNIVIVGSGLLVGHPIADWLIEKTQKLIIINEGGLDTNCLKEADLIITGTGVPCLIKGKDIKKGSIVIDYGYGRKNGILSGDIEAKSVQKIAKYFTPTPHGTGPIVVAMLFENFYKLNKS